MISRFLRFPNGRSRALTLSYDDGVLSDCRLVSILSKYGIKCTFNVNSGLFPSEETVFSSEHINRRMKGSEILLSYPIELCEIACHGYTHPWLEKCDDANAVCEVMEDRKALENLLNRRVQGMAYPYGTYNDRIVEILRYCGIRYCRTVDETENFHMPSDWLRLSPTCHHNNPRLMELAEQFLMDNHTPEPRLFYLWGHSFEFNRHNNWYVIEEFAETMSGHDDIWYATNMEIYNVWQDFMRLESTADGHQVYNPNVRTVWIADRDGKAYEIAPGQTLIL